jgi:hypothetical protein
MVMLMQANERRSTARNGHIGKARLSVRLSYLKLSSISGMPHHTTAAMNTLEKMSAISFTTSAAGFQRPPNTLNSSGISVTVRCASLRCDTLK